MRIGLDAGVCWILVGSLGVPVAHAELQRLDDADLSNVSGQTGISIGLGVKMEVGSISYFDDGNAIHLQGVKVGSSTTPGDRALHDLRVDIDADASLNLDYLVSNRRVEVTDIRFSDDAVKSMGGFFFDHSLAGNLKIRSGGALSADGYTFDSAFVMTDGRMGYRTNGNEVFLDGITMSVDAPGMTLDLNGNVIEYRVPTLRGSFDVAAIRYSNNPLNHGNTYDVSSGALLRSYGGLQGDFDLSSQYFVKAGGRHGAEGLTVDASTTINSANFIYVDDGNRLALKGIEGFLNIDRFTLDVQPDWLDRQSLALGVDRLNGRLDIDRVEIGNGGRSVGAISVDFDLSDRVIDGVLYENRLYVGAGGHPNAGPQGMRIAAQWSLNDANVRYTDNGNTVIFSGLQSWGQGDILVNVTRAETLGGTQFFDGLRIGFDGVKGGYRFDGLRVGDDSQPLQGGTELLLALGFYPAYDFEISGHITLGAGGRSGSGLTVNSDVHVTNGRAAILSDENGKGLWASDLDYDMHVRNMTIDVTEDGLAIVTGEAWSTMDIGNFRIGAKDTGGSLGRFVVQKYETGSSMTISAGGAGNVCVGAIGANAGACASAGGRWEERGDEGVTVALKTIFAKAISDTKRNRFTWETNRVTDAGGRLVNDSGTKLVVNNFYTSDGGDFNGDGVEDNTFGIQNTLGVDVYQTKVVKKADGPDMNGVSGSRGDEKIMDSSAPAGYRYVSSPTAADIANRPLGFAVRAHTQFRELAIGNVDLVHPTGGAATMVYGAKIQNMDLKTNLTATPIQ